MCTGFARVPGVGYQMALERGWGPSVADILVWGETQSTGMQVCVATCARRSSTDSRALWSLRLICRHFWSTEPCLHLGGSHT